MPRPPILALILFTACGPETLGGSLTSVMDLSYDKAELRWTTEEVAVAFVRKSGDVALQVTAALTGEPLTTAQLNLAEKLTPTTQRGKLSRSVRNDSMTTFPLLERGVMQLSTVPVPGQSVSGSFSVTFVQGATEPFGRTVNGRFDALVQQQP
jgi:hypothetical protein